MITRLRELFNLLKLPSHSRTLAILGLLIVITAIPLTVYIAQKQQEIRQRATEGEIVTCYNGAQAGEYQVNNLGCDRCTLKAAYCIVNGVYGNFTYQNSSSMCSANGNVCTDSERRQCSDGRQVGESYPACGTMGNEGIWLCTGEDLSSNQGYVFITTRYGSPTCNQVTPTPTPTPTVTPTLTPIPTPTPIQGPIACTDDDACQESSVCRNGICVSTQCPEPEDRTGLFTCRSNEGQTNIEGKIIGQPDPDNPTCPADNNRTCPNIVRYVCNGNPSGNGQGYCDTICDTTSTNCTGDVGGSIPTPTPTSMPNQPPGSGNGIACRDLRPNETIPPGSHNSSIYFWKADCGGATCTTNATCPQNNFDQANVNPLSSNWCYGFSPAWKCLKLVRNVCQTGTEAACFAPTTTPTPTGSGATATPTPTRAATPTPTPTFAPGTTALNLSLNLIGIGNNIDVPGGGVIRGNASPRTASRQVEVKILNAGNQEVITVSGPVNYNSSNKRFEGKIPLGTNFTTGDYIVKVKPDKYLRKQIGKGEGQEFQRITAAQGVNNDQENRMLANIVAGDINNDNVINVQDYNIYVGCFGSRNNASCGENKRNVDLNDDGTTDSASNMNDYILLLYAFAVRNGD